ncbi:MAG TPA: penicillin-binding protein activator [Xanthomonadaceae bacterium]|nr:penicillin-binding protein activator [Xanthomonadaceae bacterium]
MSPTLGPSLRLLPILFLTAVLGACAMGPARMEPAPVAQEAEALFARGEFAAAADAFEGAADGSRRYRDHYLLRAAESWRELGEIGAAESVVARIDPARLVDEQALRLALLRAELAIAGGEDERAVALLPTDAGGLPDGYRARYHELRARALAGTDPAAAALERAHLAPLLRPAEAADNDRAIATLLRRLDDRRLRALAESLPDTHPLVPLLRSAFAQRGLPLPESMARAPAFEPGALLPPADLDGYRPPYKIALLLPSRGTHARAASAVRDGFFAAYFAESRRRPEVVVIDSGGDADSAVQALRQAVADGAQAVVGPLSREAVAGVFESHAATVPLVALNRPGEVPPPPGSISFALAPEEEARAAAERLAALGARHVVVIHGSEESDRRAADAFAARLANFGGAVPASIQLPAGQPNYEPLLAPALGSHDGMAPGPVDAVFLAVGAEQARLLIPQIRILGRSDLSIVATSSLHAPGSSARENRELDGIVFTELPWLLDQVDGGLPRSQLRDAFRSARGPAGRLFAFGADAFRLMAWLDHLTTQPGARIQGATGELLLDGFGNVSRTPAWAVFRNGRAQPADRVYFEDTRADH